ncbi:MAG: DEAD/DEAH box helicase family protein [Crocosphaera sp.]|nr:DEAD/DEAH box helicase family protein [Crocosphaera sp.]
MSSNSEDNQWRDRFAVIPFEHNAITKVLEAIANKQDRMLLTLATGTGKTCIAFQIAWKLFHSRWNNRRGVSGAELRRPRILFLADRNTLANQAFRAFSAFQADALVRIDPEAIAKKGKVPKNGSVFFTIFQTFMTETKGKEEPTPNFGEYPPDFFDLIIIDECSHQYIREGVRELAQEKLPQLLELKYHSINDAINELGEVRQIREVFMNFQAFLYLEQNEAI